MGSVAKGNLNVEREYEGAADVRDGAKVIVLEKLWPGRAGVSRLVKSDFDIGEASAVGDLLAAFCRAFSILEG
jgi:hypothetical protein